MPNSTPEPPAPTPSATPSATTCATTCANCGHDEHSGRCPVVLAEIGLRCNCPVFVPAPASAPAATPEPPAPTPSATTAKCARCHGRGYILDYAGGESEPECRGCNGTGRATYYCMACPQTFSTAERANAHHDETGHNQTFRPPGSANRPVPPASAPAATPESESHAACPFPCPECDVAFYTARGAATPEPTERTDR